jgi:hypothetical protein
VQVLRARGWVTVRLATTAADGRFGAVVQPTATRRVRARFAGATDLLPSTSRPVFLVVRPVIVVSPVPARLSRGVRVPISGTVTPSKRRLLLVVQRRKGSGFARHRIKAVRVRLGRFSTSFTPRTRGLYRIYLVSAADSATGRARSRPYLVRVSKSSRRGGAIAPR